MKMPHIIYVMNPNNFCGTGSIITLELADEEAAKRVAHRIALDTGRCVTVRDAEVALIDVIPATAKQ